MAAYIRTDLVAALYHAGDGAGAVSGFLHFTSDAFFHAGCPWTGLHENRQGERRGMVFSVFKHALRNAILPVVTYLGPLLAYTVTGSFIVEKIFTIPGLGSEFIGAITGRDYPLIMGTTIFLATLIITMNVVVDILYTIIDPRIKLK